MLDQQFKGTSNVGRTKKKQRLAVKKESIRALSAADLQQAVGGHKVARLTSRYCPPTE